MKKKIAEYENKFVDKKPLCQKTGVIVARHTEHTLKKPSFLG